MEKCFSSNGYVRKWVFGALLHLFGLMMPGHSDTLILI